MTDGYEVLRREVNTRIHALEPGRGGTNAYLCECGHVTCAMKTIALYPAVFGEIAAIRGARLVAPGHETPGTEIVREGRGYLAVRQNQELLSPPSR